MRHSFTAVIARNEEITQGFLTEPYECGWASEARWFVRPLEWSGSGTVRLYTQLSPDGLCWCNNDLPPMEVGGVDMATGSVDHFGNWLRLRAEVDADARLVAIIYLVLKE